MARTGAERLVHELVQQIEHVRAQRRARWSEEAHPEGRQFTQEELTRSVYRSYKNMLLGRTRRLPSRQALLQIADYLECSLAERNELLAIAQYALDPSYPSGPALRASLETLEATLALLPLPAAILLPGWHVHTANRAHQALFGLPPFPQIPTAQRAVLQFIFQPELGLRPRLAHTPEIWRANADAVLRLFRRSNRSLHHEPWYDAQLRRLRPIPAFSTAWGALGDGAPPEVAEMRLAAGPEGRLIRAAFVRIHSGPALYPSISAVIPLDEPARAVFGQLGAGPFSSPLRP